MTPRHLLTLAMTMNYWYGFIALPLLLAVQTQAALLSPGGAVAPMPGAANPPDVTLAGTVLADVTVPFANGGTAPANLAPGQLPVTISFRGTNATMPFYLLSRYTTAGATFGAIPGNPAPGFTGTLRTVVVQETLGGTLDFYLQVANDTQGGAPGEPNDIFRVSAGGFNTFGFAGDALDVFFRTDGIVADVIPGVTPATVGEPGAIEPISADRLANNNFDPAFDFSSDIGGGSSIFGDEISRFLLIRTSATAFGPSIVTISSTGTAYVSSFAPTPEPGSLALLATGMIGAIAWRRRTRRRN